MQQVENNGSSMKPIDVTPIDFEEPWNRFTDMKNGKSTKPNLKAQRSVSDDVTEPEFTTKPKKSVVMTKGFDCSSPMPMISSPNEHKHPRTTSVLQPSKTLATTLSLHCLNY
ncbi:hypothetical protein HanXRQr2_Chr05g0193901 [Helianthus annuus]|uniref:Uncharacterized protein n=1 Tax=Helianthus annuus TaxID=4232 RepID=A0A251UKI4_HELAN|nr:hypothetical protein HanXRQr2_Chr05g0193901 [Helianthus annuus]